MIGQQERQFATFVIADLFPKLALATGDASQFITQLQNTVPDLKLNDVKDREVSREMWVDRIATVIVDHYAGKYEPGKLRQTA